MDKGTYLGFLVAFTPLVTSSLRDISSSPGANQGIEGYVYRISGNQMPSPDTKPSKPRGFKTTVYIYPLTNLSQVKRKDNAPFYSVIQTKPVKKVVTDSNGHFRANLPAGSYSLFVKIDSLYFANRFDGQNNIFPVNVLPGKMTPVEFKVDYATAY